MIPAPIILGNWFKKKTGMAVGISAAFSGLVGMIGSSFLGMAIPAFGWRVSYVAVGIVSTALVLPISLFILRYKPEEMGLLAENVEQRAVSGTSAPASVENGTPIKELLRQPEFYIAVGAYWTSVSCAYLNSFLTPCGIAAGLTLQAAAMMTSISLLGNMSSKLILGKISDSLGIIRTFEVSIALAFLGHVLLFVGSPETVMAGSLFYGVTLPLSSVMMPLFCRIFWNGETYSTAYAYSTMVGTLLGAPFNMWFGTFYDITGDYRLTIGVSAAMLIMLTFLIILEGVRLKRAKSGKSPSQAR
jgi:MFS family permease